MTDKIGNIPYLACGEPFLYLTTSHMETQEPSLPQTDPDYKRWVVDHWDVSVNEVPLSPAEWRAMKHRFDGWRDNL